MQNLSHSYDSGRG
jgi:hypothetical protein